MIRRLFAPAALALLVPAAATAAPAAPAEVPVAVLAHAVMAGDLLQASDFTPADRPAGLARGALDPRQAAGQEAARPIPAGSVVRSFDVRTPRLVHRGEPVMIAYHAGGITITTRGRALAGAGAGETVRVVADSTSRTLDGVVGPDGTVLIGQ